MTGKTTATVETLAWLPVTSTDPACDPWVPDDPDDDQDPLALLSYWKEANESPVAQKRLIADQWRLWRLARDLADALESLLVSAEPPGSA